MLLKLLIVVILIFAIILFLNLALAIGEELTQTAGTVLATGATRYALMTGSNRFWMQDLRTQWLTSTFSLLLSLVLENLDQDYLVGVVALVLQLLTIFAASISVYSLARRKVVQYYIHQQESVAE
jgi:hypothetical protein